jgi:hypothetical protein
MSVIKRINSKTNNDTGLEPMQVAMSRFINRDGTYNLKKTVFHFGTVSVFLQYAEYAAVKFISVIVLFFITINCVR